MAAKLKLNASPTFKAPVPIPVHGGGEEPVTFTFRHRTKQALDEFVASREGRTDVQSVMEMATAWDLAEEFNEENVQTLCSNYIGAPIAIYRTYIDEHVKVKLGN